MQPNLSVSKIHALCDVDQLAKEQQLPHFFKDKLRLTVLRSSGIKQDMLKVYAEIFKVAAQVAKECHYKLIEIHKYSDMDNEAQVARFKVLTGLEHTGHMPNPVMTYAMEYAAYKTHHKEARELKRLKAG